MTDFSHDLTLQPGEEDKYTVFLGSFRVTDVHGFADFRDAFPELDGRDCRFVPETDGVGTFGVWAKPVPSTATLSAEEKAMKNIRDVIGIAVIAGLVFAGCVGYGSDAEDGAVAFCEGFGAVIGMAIFGWLVNKSGMQ